MPLKVSLINANNQCIKLSLILMVNALIFSQINGLINALIFRINGPKSGTIIVKKIDVCSQKRYLAKFSSFLQVYLTTCWSNQRSRLSPNSQSVRGVRVIRRNLLGRFVDKMRLFSMGFSSSLLYARSKLFCHDIDVVCGLWLSKNVTVKPLMVSSRQLTFLRTSKFSFQLTLDFKD